MPSADAGILFIPESMDYRTEVALQAAWGAGGPQVVRGSGLRVTRLDRYGQPLGDGVDWAPLTDGF